MPLKFGPCELAHVRLGRGIGDGSCASQDIPPQSQRALPLDKLGGVNSSFAGWQPSTHVVEAEGRLAAALEARRRFGSHGRVAAHHPIETSSWFQ